MIYTASAASVLLFLAWIVWQADYRPTELGNHWITAGLMLYLLGLAATLIYPGHWSDVSLYGRKALFLVLTGVMLMACQHPTTRTAGLIGSFLGFWIAAALTLYSMPWEDGGLRLHGASWSIDIWGVLCGLLAVFLIPGIFLAD